MCVCLCVRVGVCKCVLTLWALNKQLKTALGALSTWFCLISSDLSGFHLTDFSQNCLISV